jgi:hypothetical protein
LPGKARVRGRSIGSRLSESYTLARNFGFATLTPAHTISKFDQRSPFAELEKYLPFSNARLFADLATVDGAQRRSEMKPTMQRVASCYRITTSND